MSRSVVVGRQTSSASRGAHTLTASHSMTLTLTHTVTFTDTHVHDVCSADGVDLLRDGSGRRVSPGQQRLGADLVQQPLRRLHRHQVRGLQLVPAHSTELSAAIPPQSRAAFQPPPVLQHRRGAHSSQWGTAAFTHGTPRHSPHSLCLCDVLLRDAALSSRLQLLHCGSDDLRKTRWLRAASSIKWQHAPSIV